MMFGTLVVVFSVMGSELLMTSAIRCPLWSSVYECQNIHNDRHNKISEHKTTRININWNPKKVHNSAYSKYYQNMRHISLY